MRYLFFLILTSCIISINAFSQEIAGYYHPLQQSEPNAGTLPSSNDNITSGNNKFAFELYHQLSARDNTGNLTFSPFSISTVMAMVYAGAKYKTADEIAQTFNFDDNRYFHSQYSQMLEQMKLASEELITLDMANGMWGQQDYSFEESYLKLIRRNYNSEVRSANFTDVAQREKARSDVNNWVESKTNKKIMDLLDQGAIDASTRLILVNAIYFMADWQKPFDTINTQKGDFFLSAETKVSAGMMSQIDWFNYYEDEYIKALELPYTRYRASMIIFLPKERNGITSLEKMLDYEYYQSVLSALNSHRVEVTFPKFKTNYKDELSKTLISMGMPLAFSPSADFSGITTTPGLYISAVIHQAYISVDEQGTEAAAATAVAMKGSALPPKINKSFIADHPFIYCIKDNETGSILFMGKIVKP